MTTIEYLSVLTAILSAAISFYYSLESRKHANSSFDIMKKQFELSHGESLNNYIDAACEAFKEKGTPAHYIKSLTGLDDATKEEIWTQSFLRYKGKMPKSRLSDICPAKVEKLFEAYSFGECTYIFKVLGSGKFESYTMEQIAKEEIPLDKKSIQKCLDFLWSEEFMKKQTTEKGTLYHLSDKGWDTLKNIK